VSIHQTSVQYVAAADRLLLRVSTHAEQLFEVWLTRRLMLRAWPHLQSMVADVAIAKVAKASTVLPEAKAMLAETMQAQALKGADFATPFAEAKREQPLGTEPMLVVEIKLTPLAGKGVRLAFLDAERRHLTLDLTEQLAVALLKLLDAALRRAEWGLPMDTPEPQAEGPRVLN
jgi:hypothetical protein